MRELTLSTSSGTCRIAVGHGLPLHDLVRGKDSHPPEHAVLVTDATLAGLYRQLLAPYDTIVIEPGEEHKTLATVEKLYAGFCERKLQRNALVVSFGGGVLSDLAGFAAATYLRGVRFGAIATTLLAQVDAAIGGKNGVDYLGFKNLVGTIRQPEFCLCDTALLKTLPKRDVSCGFAEIIKHAAIRDAELFEYLEKHRSTGLALVQEEIDYIVHRSVSVKVKVVQADETEQGERRILNFGHTLGHAVERETKLPHGEAIAIGMVLAARLSLHRNLISQPDVDRLTALIAAYQLPTENPCKIDTLMEAIERDKKRQGDGILFVLLDRIGNARVENLSFEEIRRVLS